MPIKNQASNREPVSRKERLLAIFIQLPFGYSFVAYHFFHYLVSNSFQQFYKASEPTVSSANISLILKEINKLGTPLGDAWNYGLGLLVITLALLKGTSFLKIHVFEAVKFYVYSALVYMFIMEGCLFGIVMGKAPGILIPSKFLLIALLVSSSAIVINGIIQGFFAIMSAARGKIYRYRYIGDFSKVSVRYLACLVQLPIWNIATILTFTLFTQHSPLQFWNFLLHAPAASANIIKEASELSLIMPNDFFYRWGILIGVIGMFLSYAQDSYSFGLDWRQKISVLWRVVLKSVKTNWIVYALTFIAAIIYPFDFFLRFSMPFGLLCFLFVWAKDQLSSLELQRWSLFKNQVTEYYCFFVVWWILKMACDALVVFGINHHQYPIVLAAVLLNVALVVNGIVQSLMAIRYALYGRLYRYKYFLRSLWT